MLHAISIVTGTDVIFREFIHANVANKPRDKSTHARLFHVICKACISQTHIIGSSHVMRINTVYNKPQNVNAFPLLIA